MSETASTPALKSNVARAMAVLAGFDNANSPRRTAEILAQHGLSRSTGFALLKEMAAEGWDYVRAETLPCEERKGLTRTQTTDQFILIFRRRARESAGAPAPLTLGQPAPAPARREPAISRPQPVPEATPPGDPT